MFVWVEPPPPSPKRTHTLHAYGKMLTKKSRYFLHDAEHMVVSSFQKYFRKGVMSQALQKGFSCASSWAGLEQAFRHSFCASLTALAAARDHEVCESALQKTLTNSGLDMKAFPWAKFVILWISSSPKRPGSQAKPHAAVQKMPIFLPNEQASTLPPLKRTLFVWNKMSVNGDGP